MEKSKKFTKKTNIGEIHKKNEKIGLEIAQKRVKGVVEKLDTRIAENTKEIEDPNNKRTYEDAKEHLKTAADEVSVRGKMSIIKATSGAINFYEEIQRENVELNRQKVIEVDNAASVEKALKLPRRVPQITEQERDALKGKSIKAKADFLTKAMGEVASGKRGTTTPAKLVQKSKSMGQALEIAHVAYKNANIRIRPSKPQMPLSM